MENGSILERHLRVGSKAWTREFMVQRVASAIVKTDDDLDDLTTMVTAAAMVEYLLRELIAVKADLSILAPTNSPLQYMEMVRLAGSLGLLPSDLKKPLAKLARVRNSFAHDIAHRLSEEDVSTLRSGLTDPQRNEVAAYEDTVVENRELPRNAALSVRCIIVCLLDRLREAVAKYDEDMVDDGPRPPAAEGPDPSESRD